MQRVISIFLVFLLIVHVIPKCYGVEPLPMDTRFKMTVFLADDIIPLSEIYTFDDVNPNFSNVREGIGSILLYIYEFLHTTINLLYIPFYDLIRIFQIAGVWLFGYIPLNYFNEGVSS